MRILLIAPYFYPDEPVGAARWNRLCKHLNKNGNEVYVIASDILSNSTDTTFSKKTVRVDFRSSFVDILLKRASSKKKGFSIEKQRQSSDPRKKNNVQKIYNALIEATGRFMRFPGAFWWSDSTIVKEGLKLIKAESINIIIATHPFSITLKVASILSNKSGLPWVADMRDGWSSYYYGEYKYGTIYYKILVLLERYYLNKASRVVSINETLAKTFEVNQDKITVIPNVFDSDLRYCTNIKPANEKKIIFGFAGSVHKNHCWDIFFEAMTNFKTEIQCKRVVIEYFGGSFGVVLEKTIEAGLPEDLVHDNGYVDKQFLNKQLLQMDILLVFGFKGAFGDTVTTGKIFDYIELGKPIIVVGPSTSELAKMVIRTRVGIVLSSVDQVTNFLEKLFFSPSEFINSFIGEINQIELNKYSAEHVSKEYLKLLENVIIEN